MNYDAMGSYYGAVNDMLREPDTEANVKPVTQTITTDPVTGEQMMTVKGRPQDLSAANPNTPTVTPAAQPTFRFGAPQGQPNQYMNMANTADRQPVAYQPAPAIPVPPSPNRQTELDQFNKEYNVNAVYNKQNQLVNQTQMPTAGQMPAPTAPDQTYQRMIQAESRGQNFAPNGQPLTSPAGAMFAAQVMPATAQNPGYGVRPAAAQTPEEYNRVGQDYYNAMLNKFGNPTAAAAAYNAGPGRVQQNLAANQGQLNVNQLPQETQQYLQRVQPGAAQPVAPRPPMIAGAPTTDVGATPTEQAIRQQAVMTPDQQYANAFILNQNNPEELTKLRYDRNAPAWVRTLASQKEFANLRNQDETAKVEQQVRTAIENNDGRALANMLSPRGKEKDEGSIAKAFLYSLIGFQSGAQAEVEKMGIKDKWDIARLGDADVTVKYNPRGEAKEAIYTSGERAGQRVGPAELEMLSGQGGAAGKTKADVSTQDVEKNGMAGRVVTENRGGRTMTYVESGGKRYAYDTTWQPRSIATAGAKADYGLITDLRKKFGTDAVTLRTEYVRAKGGFKNAQEESDFMNTVAGFNNAQPTGNLPAPPQLPAVNVPGAQPPAAPVPNTIQPGIDADRGAVRQPPGAVRPVVPTQPINAPTTAAPTTAPGTSTFEPILTAEARAKAEGTNVAKDVNKSYNAQSIYNVVEPINRAIQTATGSGLGAKVDDLAAFFGKSTEGAKGAAQLNILADSLLKAVPRFEGPQSDKDTAAYAAAAGQLADRTIPTATRVAALKTIIEINKKYAPDLDWSFGADKKAEAGAAGATKSGATKTINGVTYEYDGRGWKKSTGI